MVFLVENDSVTSYILKKNINFPVMGFKGVEGLMDQISKHRPDLVILDNALPEMKGVDLVKKIIKKFPRQRAVIVSGTWDEQLNEKAIDSGAAFCIWKNGDLKKVSSKINMYLDSMGIYPKKLVS